MNKCNNKYSKVIRVKFKCICIIAWFNFQSQSITQDF